MYGSALWIWSGVMLTVIAGPLTLVASQAGKADPGDLYIVFDVGRSSFAHETLETYGAKGVGPLRGVLASTVHAPPPSREHLLQAGYIMLPAGKLAAICGIETDTNAPERTS